MERLDTLWQYQELDLLIDQYILNKKNSDLRQQLLKIRNYLIKQEENLIRMDSDAIRRNNFMNKLQQEYDGIDERIKAQVARLESEEFESFGELEDLAKEGFHLRDRIRRKEEELQKLTKELNSFENKLNDIRRRVAKAKNEYTAVKKDYDLEVAKINQEITSLKKKRDSIGSSIDKELMAKYKNIKASRSPVMSPLTGNQCGGCYMSLASLVLQRVRDRKRIVECENCGRIIFDNQL